MNSITGGFFGVLGGIIIVAIIAVVVSRNSNTAQLITESAKGLTNALSVAVSPVTASGTRGTARNA